MRLPTLANKSPQSLLVRFAPTPSSFMGLTADADDSFPEGGKWFWFQRVIGINREFFASCYAGLLIRPLEHFLKWCRPKLHRHPTLSAEKNGKDGARKSISKEKMTKHRESVPHPCAFYLAQGWDAAPLLWGRINKRSPADQSNAQRDSLHGHDEADAGRPLAQCPEEARYSSGRRSTQIVTGEIQPGR